MASFCAVLFPLAVLDEIWDVIESISEGFLTYSCMCPVAVSESIIVIFAIMGGPL